MSENLDDVSPFMSTQRWRPRLGFCPWAKGDDDGDDGDDDHDDVDDEVDEAVVDPPLLGAGMLSS